MFHPVQHCMVNRFLWVHLHNHTHNATWHFLLYFTCTTTPTMQHDTSYCSSLSFTLPATLVPLSSPTQPHPQYNMTHSVVLYLHNHTHNATWHFLLYLTCTTSPTMQHDTSCCTSPAQPHPQCNMTLPVVIHPVSHCLLVLHWFLWVHLHNHSYNATWHFLSYFTHLIVILPATLASLSSPVQPHPRCNITLTLLFHIRYTGSSDLSWLTQSMKIKSRAPEYSRCLVI